MTEKKKILYIERDPVLTSRNYIGMFDLTKGLLMLQIVVDHALQNQGIVTGWILEQNALTQLLCSPFALIRYGGISMLFMLCGYGIRKQPPLKFAKKQLRLFLFPYGCVIIAVLLINLLKQLLLGGSLFYRLVTRVLPFFLGFHPGVMYYRTSLVQIGPIWTFLTYTLSSIWLNWVLQQKQVLVQILLITSSTVLAYLTIGLPALFCFQQVFICAGLLYAGMHLKRIKLTSQSLPWWILTLVWVLCCISILLGGYASISSNRYSLGLGDLITAYLAGMICLYLYQKLDVFQGLLADGIRWIGRHMMWFCCFHTVTFVAIPWTKLAQRLSLSTAAAITLEAVISILFALMGCYLLKRLMRCHHFLRRYMLI